jgi:cytochrome c553
MSRARPLPALVLTASVACVTVSVWTAAARNARAAEPTPEQAEFFESKVRPLLVEQCQSCHSKKKTMGGLRLDTPAGMTKGGDSGPAVVPGDPEKSPMIRAVRYVDNDLKMPPKGQMPKEAVETLAVWVKMGAPWPAAAKVREGDDESWKRHWAFKPVGRPESPALKDSALAARAAEPSVDPFVFAKLEAKGLHPNPPADRRTLLRRATFDLTGLPPTQEEIAAFLADPAPDDAAFGKAVDRLLASPAYGERWGRLWLDVARYADTKGYVFNEERRYPYAYTYRDWVIRAFNEDMPYDRFVQLQIAADRMVKADGPDRGHLAAMGFLTVGRRFLNNTPDIIDDRLDVIFRGLMGLTVACARCHDHKFDPVPIKDYYSLYGVFLHSPEPKDLPIIADAPDTEAFRAFQKELAAREGKVADARAAIRNEKLGIIRRSAAEAVAAGLPKAVAAGVRTRLTGADSPLKAPPPDALDKLFNRAEKDKIRELQNKVDRFKADSPVAPPRAMVLGEAPVVGDAHVFIRGNPNNRGEKVPRQFLSAIAGPDRKPFKDGSGRLELARAVTDPANPLTARVIVNRVWMHHFGRPLVGTPGDFGLRSDPPSHPELLDRLAADLVADGWSLKRLHRRMMMSSAYRLSSADAGNAEAARADPENLLYWKANRRRLDFEGLRDSMLAVAGTLDRRMGGPAVDITAAPFPPRRSVYAFIDRQNLPGVFRTFDLASPDTSTPQRHQTTVPQQALFLMNSPFLLEQARRLAARPEVTSAGSDSERVVRLHRLAFGRGPTAEEAAAAEEFLRIVAEAPAVPAEPPAWRYGYGPYDAEAKALKGFTPLPHFTGAAWQGGAKLPDAKLGWLMLAAGAGHPDAKAAVVRRWVSPIDGEVSVSGSLAHGSKQGNGVMGFVLGPAGEAGRWTAFNGKADTAVAKIAVRKGQAIDFVVDCRGDVGFDGFTWAPVVRSADGRRWSAEAEFSGPPGAAPPPPDRWMLYAQVLLLTNEFAFVE